MSGDDAEPSLTDLLRKIADLTARLEETTVEKAQMRADLTDARRALNESRSRYRLIVNSIVDYAIIATDLDGRITLWTDSAATLFGWPEQRMLGRSIEEIFTDPDILAKIPTAAMREALANSSTQQERWYRRADGLYFFASGEIMLLRDDSDALAGFLHILRDRTEERRIQHELEASRERLDYALNSSSLVGTWDWDVVNNLVYTDDKFRAFFGLPSVAATGPLPIERFLEGIHEDDRDGLREKILSAMANGHPFTSEYRTIDREGNEHWVSAQGRCFLDAAGDPIRFPGAIIDITREKKREARQAALLRLGDEGPEQFGDAVDYSLRTLAIIGETLGLGQAGYAAISEDGLRYTILDQWTNGISPPLAESGRIGQLELRLLERLRNAGLLVVEDVMLHPATRDAAEIWKNQNIASLVNMAVVEDGQVRILLYLFSPSPRQWEDDELAFVRDILNRAWTYSRRLQAERLLIETETRLRLAQEAAELGTLDYHPLTGALDIDARGLQILGVYDADGADFTQHIIGAIVDTDRPGIQAEIAEALAANSETALDLYFRIADSQDGSIRHVRLEAQTVVRAMQVVRLVGAIRDITDAKTVEERQAALMRELRHRVNNTLAMVDGLARLTLRRARNAKEGLQAFSTRLAALQQAHETLTGTSWNSAPIRSILERSIARQPDAGARISLDGPDLYLQARQSFALALAMHELLTNAARYGALAVPEGRVSIEWTEIETPGGPGFRLIWQESKGLPARQPRRLGLGIKLIRQSLPSEIGGKVQHSFLPEGVRVVIEAPVLPPEED